MQIDKEDNAILHWVFQQTLIPSVISEQRKGKILHVEGFGDYTVEWHMAGDLKTLKCMYNVPAGPATISSPCLYCMSAASVLDPRNWKKGPERDFKDPNFKPVLDIPLCRVHICTMHALCRIVEKLVYLYICFAWTLKPKRKSEISIRPMERVLSNIGLHGGNVKIEEDTKRSTTTSRPPTKSSIGKLGDFFHASLGMVRNQACFSVGKLYTM